MVRDQDGRSTPSEWKYAIPVALLAALGIALTIGMMQLLRHYVHQSAEDITIESVSMSAERAGHSMGTLNGTLSAVTGWFAVDDSITNPWNSVSEMLSSTASRRPSSRDSCAAWSAAARTCRPCSTHR